MFYGKISGFGSYHPSLKVHNNDLSEFMETDDEWIYSRTGIRNRYISNGENTSDICYKAALDIIENTKIDPLNIDLIIVATVTPDFATPSVACMVQGKIGATNAFAFDISAACSGFIYALSVCEKYMMSGSCKNALVIGGETMSREMDWSDRTTSVLFGDAAAGVLVTKDDKKHILAEDLHSDGTNCLDLYIGNNKIDTPFGKSEEEYQKVYMNGRNVFEFAIRNAPKSISKVLENANLTAEDIAFFVPHQANKRIVDGISKKMKVGIDKFQMNMEEYGNTSGASIPTVLCEMYQKGLIKIDSSDKIVMTGFGAGFTWGTILLEI